MKRLETPEDARHRVEEWYREEFEGDGPGDLSRDEVEDILEEREGWEEDFRVHLTPARDLSHWRFQIQTISSSEEMDYDNEGGPSGIVWRDGRVETDTFEDDAALEEE